MTADGHVVVKPRTLRVTIPAGVTDGQRIRLAGQGSPGIGGGPPGDLFLEVNLRPHAHFKVEAIARAANIVAKIALCTRNLDGLI